MSKYYFFLILFFSGFSFGVDFFWTNHNPENRFPSATAACNDFFQAAGVAGSAPGDQHGSRSPSSFRCHRGNRAITIYRQGDSCPDGKIYEESTGSCIANHCEQKEGNTFWVRMPLSKTYRMNEHGESCSGGCQVKYADSFDCEPNLFRRDENGNPITYCRIPMVYTGEEAGDCSSSGEDGAPGDGENDKPPEVNDSDKTDPPDPDAPPPSPPSQETDKKVEETQTTDPDTGQTESKKTEKETERKLGPVTCSVDPESGEVSCDDTGIEVVEKERVTTVECPPGHDPEKDGLKDCIKKVTTKTVDCPPGEDCDGTGEGVGGGDKKGSSSTTCTLDKDGNCVDTQSTCTGEDCPEDLTREVTGGDDCAAAPQCSGDAIDCALLLQVWEDRCALSKEDLSAFRSQAGITQTLGDGSQIDIETEEHNISDFIDPLKSTGSRFSAGSAPVEKLSLSFGGLVTVSMEPLFDLARILKPLVLLIFAFMSARIVMRGIA